MSRFDAAPWPTSLKVTSVAATALLAGASFAVIRAIPRGTGVPFAETFGMLIAFVPPLTALTAILFICTVSALLGIRKIRKLDVAEVFRG